MTRVLFYFSISITKLQHLSRDTRITCRVCPGDCRIIAGSDAPQKESAEAPPKSDAPPARFHQKNCFCLRYNSNNSFLHLALLNSSLSSIRPIESHLAPRNLTTWVSKKSSSARPVSSLVTMSTISVWSLPQPQRPQYWPRADTIQSSMLRSINSPSQPSMSPHPQPS